MSPEKMEYYFQVIQQLSSQHGITACVVDGDGVAEEKHIGFEFGNYRIELWHTVSGSESPDYIMVTLTRISDDMPLDRVTWLPGGRDAPKWPYMSVMEMIHFWKRAIKLELERL